MIGCLYIPAFPAWALRHLQAQCNDAPTGGLAAFEREHIVAVTPRARRAGVVPGMPSAEAACKAPGVRVCARDRRAEAAAWVDVMQRLNAHTPRIQPVDTGHLYFAPVRPEPLQAYLCTMRLGAALAPDRPAAHLGALETAPGTVRRFAHGDVATLMAALRTERLLHLGYSPSLVDALTSSGYPTLAALQDASRRWLQDRCGREGVRLHRLLHPSRVDRAPVPLYTAPATVQRATSWPAPVAYWEQVQPALARLLSRAVSALGAQTCQRVTVHLVDATSGAVHSQSRLLAEPVRTRSALSPVAHALLRGLMQPGLQVETLRIGLGVLAIPEVYPDIFFRHAVHPHQHAAPSLPAPAEAAGSDEWPAPDPVGKGRMQVGRS